MYTKINLKQIIDLNVKRNTLKLLQKKQTGENIHDLESSKYFSDMTQKAKSMKEIDHLDFNKIKNSALQSIVRKR